MDRVHEGIRSTEAPIQAVIQCVINVLETKDGAERWLKTPHALLENARPIDLLDDEDGRARVLRLLAAIEHGLPV